MLFLSHVLFTNSCNRLNSFHCHSTVKGILEMPSHTSSWTLHQSSYSINYIHICSLLLHLVSYPVSTSSVAHTPSSNFHHFNRALQYLHLQTSCTSGAVSPMSTLHCYSRLKSLSQDCISHTRSSTSTSKAASSFYSRLYQQSQISSSWMLHLFIIINRL